MNNTMTIKLLNRDNSNIANIKTQNHQIMTTDTDRIFKLKAMIKNPVVVNYIFFTVIILTGLIP